MPTARMAPWSQSSDITMKQMMIHTPDHLVPRSRPRQTAPASRHGRQPSGGAVTSSGSGVGGKLSRQSTSRVRILSRSTRKQPKAASVQNITKMSSSAVRLITNSRPSAARSRPARQPMSVERNMRRAMRAVIRIARVPQTAGMKRHPNGVKPNSHSPAPIIHLPTGGCTALPWWLATSVRQMCGLAMRAWSSLAMPMPGPSSCQPISWPKWMVAQASLA